jgi:hypothetical protein
MFTECVTAPRRMSATLRIDAASGVSIWRLAPRSAVADAAEIVGRVAS